VYADQVSRGEVPQAAALEFHVRRGDGAFALVQASLREDGSLVPLFLAFNLITPEEAAQFAVDSRASGPDGRDLFQWLSDVAADAALAAEQHDALKRAIRTARAELEDRYGFASVEVGYSTNLDGSGHQQQLDALAALQGGLADLEAEGDINCSTAFQGLRVQLYHPDATPLSTVGYQDADGTFNVRSVPLSSHVADTGVVHIVADRDEIASKLLGSLDLSRAQLLARVSTFWAVRSRVLANALCSLLSVENVWFDTKSDAAEQRFVLWAGSVFERREDFSIALRAPSYAFSIYVHSDTSSPLLEFVASSSVLQVRTDCPPKHLLAFMCSEAGALANEAAAMVADSRAEEEQALAAVRDALGAKHVVRVCSSYDQHKVLDAAQRLVQAAPSIRASVDLSGVSLAIDDCYEVWDSGFVSIPFDFSLADIEPQLQALLAAPSSNGNGAAAVDRRNGAAVASACGLRHPVVHRVKPMRLVLPGMLLPAQRGFRAARRGGALSSLRPCII